MKFATRLKFTATGTSAATITVATGITGFRTIAQVISDGVNDTTAIKVGDSGVPFMIEDGNGNWEDSLFTVTNTTTLTRDSIVSSSAGGTTAPTYTGNTLTVYNIIPGAWLRKVVISTDGVNTTDLTAVTTPPDTYIIPIVDPATGIAYKVTVASLKTLFGTPATQAITVNTPSAQVVGTAFSVSGTYTNGTPTALDWSINGGSTWNAASAPTIGSGTYSFGGVTIPSANASQTVMVRDHTTLVVGTSAAFAVTAPETLTVSTPTTQTVGTAFAVTGTYANGTPTALDYRLSDDAAGVWTQVTTATISGGTFSFNITPSTTSAGRTVSVRDRNNTSATATSGTYVVNSAPPTVTSVTVSPSTASVAGGQTQQFTATVNGTNSPSQAVTWSISAGNGTISASGLYTAPAATASSQSVTVKALSNQDNTTFGTATVTVPAQTIAVTNPGTQTVGTPYTLSGTWTGLQPTALDFQTTDNGGTPTAWTAATSPTINANGTWSFSVNPSTSSASRTISVRDHTTLVVGTSTAYVVNAAAPKMADTYLLTNTNSASASFTAATMSGTSPNMSASTTTRVNIRSALTNSATYPNSADVKFVWGKLGNACPAVFADTVLHAGGNGNNADTNTTAIGTAQHLGGWADSSSGFFGTFTPANSFNAWGTPGTYVLWVMFSDGSSKMYDNNQGQNSPLTWVLS